MNSKIEVEKPTQEAVASTLADAHEEDESSSRRVVWKFDLHIMPWLFGLWFFAALDRANIGKLSKPV